ncbi:MAG: zinc-ribbon domain-containing protein [Phycisphaera sp.]|nr:zinc-ribbon domain-containing protein [Phycisphaera sp.]
MPRRTGQRDEWEDEEGGNEASGGEEYGGADVDDDDTDDPHDAADRARFSSEKGFCPECGAEIYDAADICPKCFSWIDGATHRKRTRFSTGFRQLVVTALLVALLSGMVGWLLFVFLR